MGIKHRVMSAWFPAALERRSLARPGGRVAVLMYHEVLPDAVELPSWSIVRESDFRTQMLHLQRHYELVSMDDALTRMRTPVRAGENSRPMAVITFDDGYAGNLLYAMPILKELQIPFTVYIATAKVESGDCHWYDKVSEGLMAAGRQSLSIPTSGGTLVYSGKRHATARRWAEINGILDKLKELSREEQEAVAERLSQYAKGNRLRMLTPSEVAELAVEPLATVGCHTHDHQLLDRIPFERARHSITRAQELLETWSGKAPRHFSYPNGNFSEPVVDLVRQLGFASAVTTESSLWHFRHDCHMLPRIGVGRFDNLNLFRAKVAGLIG